MSAASDVYKRQARRLCEHPPALPVAALPLDGLTRRKKGYRERERAVSYTHLRAHETRRHL
eukprot:11016421-Prorocentrum_lima.AAC.1